MSGSRQLLDLPSALQHLVVAKHSTSNSRRILAATYQQQLHINSSRATNRGQTNTAVRLQEQSRSRNDHKAAASEE